jgi:hypothetical protein
MSDPTLAEQTGPLRATSDPLPAVCAVCHTRIAWHTDLAVWIHAVTYPRPWHPATPTKATS